MLASLWLTLAPQCLRNGHPEPKSESTQSYQGEAGIKDKGVQSSTPIPNHGELTMLGYTLAGAQHIDIVRQVWTKMEDFRFGHY